MGFVDLGWSGLQIVITRQKKSYKNKQFVNKKLSDSYFNEFINKNI